MNIFILNGSPRGTMGNTFMLVDKLYKGMVEAGAEVTLLNVKDANINSCCGNFHCWYGKCIHDDDFTKLYLDKFKNSDIFVIATPVNFGGMSEYSIKAINRIIPLSHPYYEVRKGVTRHVVPARLPARQCYCRCADITKSLLFSVIEQTKDISESLGSDFLPPILRPHSAILKYMSGKVEPIEDVLSSCYSAGFQLAETGSISDDTLNSIKKPLMPRDEYILQINTLSDRLSVLATRRNRGSK
jgi:multimeric flavodoxin WrbA